MHTAIFWFRNDLRLTDNPALVAAAQSDCIIPLYIIDEEEFTDLHNSPNRLRFLLQSLADTKTRLQAIGADLIIRRGNPTAILEELINSHGVTSVHYTIEYRPLAVKRDQQIKQMLDKQSVEYIGHPGILAVDSIVPILTQKGKVVNVFTPFWKQWAVQQRRELAKVPERLTLPDDITVGTTLALETVPDPDHLSPHAQPGGETAALAQLERFLGGPINEYHTLHDDLATEGTSRLSSYLNFGTISVRYIESLLPDSEGAAAFHRQLAWRDFYQYILFHHPETPQLELQPRYHTLTWNQDDKLLQSWQSGTTGYPVVDAAMRQLQAEGYMHNRARLIVGSFLTKDLGLDWRHGEDHFMQWLTDGDQASNVGNWQWIASVGVDPAPMFRRLYNPTLQQQRFDPTGAYVRRYVPELAKVPDAYLTEPWKMTPKQQTDAGCIIGVDYPAPIVDHAMARKAALERYRATAIPKSI